MAVDWNSEDMQKWMDLTQKKQQQFHDYPNIRGRECELSHTSNVKEIIRFALSEVSGKEPLENLTDKQLKHINKIFDSIERSMKGHKIKENICVSVLFVLAKTGDDYSKFPVISLVAHDVDIQQDTNIFIDLRGRVYKDWQDYLKNNKLPSCIFCYPKNGVYWTENGTLQVEYGISPAGKREIKFLRYFNIVDTVLSVAGAVVGVAALCIPVAMELVAD